MKNYYKILLSCFVLVFAINSFSQITVSEINIYGNKITKCDIVMREVTLKTNHTYLENIFQEELQNTRKNLNRTGLFNFVTIAVVKQNDSAKINIKLQERWYFLAYPILEIAANNFDSYLTDKEWHRVNYGVSFDIHNFRGRNEFLHFKARFGYLEQFGIYYANPYIDKNKKHGIWIGTDFFRQKELAYSIENYKYQYTRNNSHIFNYLNSQIGYQFRPFTNSTLKARITYNKFNTADTVFKLNPDYLVGLKDAQLLFLGIKYQYDKSDNKVYPTDGFISNILIEQRGFGILNNFVMLKTNLNIQYHKKLYNRIYFSAEAEYNQIFHKQQDIPFPLYLKLGHNQYARGLDNHIFISDFYTLFKTNIRYELFKYKELTIPLIPWEQFSKTHIQTFAYAFADGGYINNYSYLYTFGIGLDFLTYYDRVLSTYIAWNSLSQKFGIFVQFKTPLIKNF